MESSKHEPNKSRPKCNENRHDHRGKKYVGVKKQEAMAELRKYQKNKKTRLRGTLQDSKTMSQPQKSTTTRFTQAERQYKTAQEKKLLKIQAIQKKQSTQEEKRKKYQQQKKEKFIKFSQRTHKGQPVMRHRIDHLLSKIKRLV